ncbi:unnamed protein product [Mytilus coruscus]|uniref:Uncharacterized protein n=1 Tax=Mytilus coruscus TaxID=42192 RepID=A0A6J7ZWT9_MYTCO|nr:unnamed protein product [Mytilus coruscus]
MPDDISNYDNPSVTEFPCKFPCPWRNKTFEVYNKDGNNAADLSFSGDGQIFTLSYDFETIKQQCYQITERFLIVREKDTDYFQCLAIFYDIESPLKFQYEAGETITLNNQTGKLTDLCGICGEGFVYEAVAPPISVPCNRPSTCTSPPGTACDTSDIIPQDCIETTTESPTTTTEQTTTITEATTTTEPTKTTKSHCGKKKHKHTK